MRAGSAGAGVLRQRVPEGRSGPGRIHGPHGPQLPRHPGLRGGHCARDAAPALQQRAAHGPQGAQRHAGQLGHGGQGRQLQNRRLW